MQKYTLNTTNDKKYEQYLLFGMNFPRTKIEQKEIISDPYTVAIYKAKMAGKNVIVEDTSFDVEEEDIGIHIKYKVNYLDKCIGKKASERILLSVLKDDNYIYVYESLIHGKIEKPKNTQYGWAYEPYFIPEGQIKPLSEYKPNFLNGRKRVSDAFNLNYWKIITTIPEDWTGSWQEE